MQVVLATNDSGLFPTISPIYPRVNHSLACLAYSPLQCTPVRSRKETLFTTFYDRRK